MRTVFAAAHALLCGLWAWLVVTIIWLPLLLLGFPVCAWLSWRRAWHMEPSKRYPNRFAQIAVWNPRWAWVFGNDEDGVLGDQRWWPAYCERRGWRDERLQAFMWSAVRNPVNNFRFTKLVDIGFRPAKLRWIGNSDDCSADLRRYRAGEIRHRLFWFYAWHGIYPAFWAIWIRDATTHHRIRLGWKFTPAFRDGVPRGDYREQSESFTTLQASVPFVGRKG